MKSISAIGVVVMASIALLQPAQGRPHGGGRSSAPQFSASAGHYRGGGGPRYYGGPRNYSAGGARYYRTSPRGMSQAAYRNRVNSAAISRSQVNRTTALNPRNVNVSNPRINANRTAALRAQGIDSRGRISSNVTRNWNRSQDHNWNGHRCHWHNNSWVIIDPWWPWYGYGWGYYPYASYYYDPYYYNGYGYGYDPVYQPEPVQAEYGYSNGYGNGNVDSTVSEVQAALAQKGYYHGTVDGHIGPETNSAVRQYQRNHGMEVTGSINQPVIDSLRRR